MADAAVRSTRDLKKIMKFAFIGLNALILGGGVYLTYISTIGHKKKVSFEEELHKEYDEFRKKYQAQPVIFAMEPLSTNLDGVPRRLIRIKINLEMLDEEGFEEVINMNAEARDTVVRILNAKSFTDLETVQGKLHLKNQIVTQVNKLLTQGVVKNVYFSDFAVQ